MLHVTHFLAIKKAIAYQFVGIYPYDWEVMPFIFNKLLKGYTYGGNAFQMQSHYQFQCLPNAFFQQQWDFCKEWDFCNNLDTASAENNN